MKEIMIEAFLQGLARKKVSTILWLFKPKRLNNALELINDDVTNLN